MKDIFRFTHKPEFENPSRSTSSGQVLIIGWDKDAGHLSPIVIEHLNKKINGRSFCEIEPVDFFSLAGVTIEKDIAQFPESKFYYGQRDDLVIFKGSEPSYERHRFLNAITDFAQHYCKVKQIYTVSGTICSIAHTDSRKILAVFNEKKLQEDLREYGLSDMNWQGTPAINSYLLWMAQREGMPGVSLWTQVPFYLAAGQDYEAIKLTLSFLDKRFNLQLDLKEMDEQIAEQNAKIEQLRQQDTEINRYIGALESGLSLSEEEQMGLIKAVSEFLEFGKS
jgi:proteasome assembly chaperone (PAC2) family protein